MIDVPVEVKDALRDGRLKKNYRIVVLQQYTDIYEIYSSHETYVVPITATYLLYNNTIPNSFRYVEITPISGGETYSINCPDNPDKTWLEFPLVEGDVIYVSNSGEHTMLAVDDRNNTTEDFTIDNHNLVTESVSIDERMCSSNKIKFGLCEGSSLEFQYFGFPTLLGRRVQVFIDVDYSVMRLVYETTLKFVRGQEVTITEDGNYRIYSETPEAFFFVYLTRGGDEQIIQATSSEDGTEAILDLLAGDILDLGWIGLSTPDVYLQKQVNKKQIESHTIPMGFFEVEKCSRQASTGIIKATAYNKLMSEYLDAKANELLIEKFGNQDVYVADVLSALLDNYQIDPHEYAPVDRRFRTNGKTPESQFSPYRYTSMTGDQGPLSPYSCTVVSPIATTSTNFRITIGARVALFDTHLSSKYRGKPIRINVDSLVTTMDERINEFIMAAFNGISSNTSADVLFSRLQNVKGDSSSSSWADQAIQAYFFSVRIEFEDGTAEVYGDSVANPDGTFEELGRKTFLNVRYVTILTPRWIYPNAANGAGLIIHIPGVEHVANRYVWIIGDPRPYVYGQDENYEFLYRMYSPPTLPNGDYLEDNTLLDLFAVNFVIGGGSAIDYVELNPTQIGDVTLRDIQSAAFETVCQFGQLDRVTDLFNGVELNHSRLYPAETLYPDDALYPEGAQSSANKSMYSQLWADEGNVHKWRNLLITYKGLDANQQEKDFVAQYVINSDGTDDYDCSDNWLFRNLIWTEEQIDEYALAMMPKMQDMTWFPFEMWCAGLPYLETGDEIEIPLGQNSYTSYVLQRQLKGIQNLQDTYINGNLDIF